MDQLMKWLNGMGGYVETIVGALGAAFGLWAALLVLNAVLGGFGVSVAPNVAGLMVGTDFWGTTGLFAGIAILVRLASSNWNHS